MREGSENVVQKKNALQKPSISNDFLNKNSSSFGFVATEIYFKECSEQKV